MPSFGFDTTRLSLWKWCRLRGAGQWPACRAPRHLPVDGAIGRFQARGADGARRDAVRLPSHPQKKTLYLDKLLIKRQRIIPPSESEEAVLPMRHRPRRRHHHRRYRPQLIRGNRFGHL